MSDNIYLELELFLDPAITDSVALKKDLEQKIGDWNKMFNADPKYKIRVSTAKKFINEELAGANLKKLAEEARNERLKKLQHDVNELKRIGEIDEDDIKHLKASFKNFFTENTIKSEAGCPLDFVPPTCPSSLQCKKVVFYTDMRAVSFDLKVVKNGQYKDLYDFLGLVPSSPVNLLYEKAKSESERIRKITSKTPEVDAQNRLAAKSLNYFKNEESKDSYDKALKRSPFDALCETKFKLWAKKKEKEKELTWEIYQMAIKETLAAGFTQEEAEWLVYEFFCITKKFPPPKPEPENNKPTKSQTSSQQQQQSPSPHSPITNKNIFDAIKRGDLEAVKEWIKNDPESVYKKDVKYHTSLHWATKYNSNAEIIKYLIKHGADVNAKNIYDDTPLHFAAYANPNVDVMKCLIENGANINAKNNNSGTPLHRAAFNNPNIDVIKCLIKHGADINAKNNSGKTPLDVANTEEKKNFLRDSTATVINKIPEKDIFDAIKQGDLKTVKEWINFDPKSVHEKDTDCNTPLIIAAWQNSNVDIIKCLLKNRADINGKNIYGNTPLIIAAWQNANVDVIKCLLENGADVNAKNYTGNTPLILAAWQNTNVEIIKCLIENGADINAKNNKGRTPLDVANTVEKKNFLRDSTDTVIKKKTYKNIFDAIKQGDLATVKEWIKIDPKSVHERDVDGSTPLHWAAISNTNVDVIKCLLERGADINAKNNGGNTPLHWAARKNSNGDVIKCLIENGADINAKNNNGTTPMNAANTEEKKNFLRNAATTVIKNEPEEALPFEDFILSAETSDMEDDFVPYLGDLSNEDIFEDIFDAIKQGDLKAVKMWIKNDPKSVHKKDADCNTPLIIAAWQNSNVDIIKCLLKNGADVNAKNNNGDTPLTLAARQNTNVDIIKCLLKNGADVNAKNIHGDTPLHLAAWQNTNIEIIKCLIENGADVYAKSNNGTTPLSAANTDEKKDILRKASTRETVFEVLGLALITGLVGGGTLVGMMMGGIFGGVIAVSIAVVLVILLMILAIRAELEGCDRNSAFSLVVFVGSVGGGILVGTNGGLFEVIIGIMIEVWIEMIIVAIIGKKCEGLIELVLPIVCGGLIGAFLIVVCGEGIVTFIGVVFGTVIGSAIGGIIWRVVDPRYIQAAFTFR
jgi:ankyrin repeat protein